MGYDAYWFYDPPTHGRPVTAPVTRWDFTSVNESVELPNISSFVNMNERYTSVRQSQTWHNLLVKELRYS